MPLYIRDCVSVEFGVLGVLEPSPQALREAYPDLGEILREKFKVSLRG